MRAKAKREKKEAEDRAREKKERIKKEHYEEVKKEQADKIAKEKLDKQEAEDRARDNKERIEKEKIEAKKRADAELVRQEQIKADFVSRKTLVDKMHKLGVTDVTVAMSKDEIEIHYKRFQEKNKQVSAGKREIITVLHNIKMCKEKANVYPDTHAGGFALPNTYPEIEPSETSYIKVIDNDVVVLFKCGAKVKYNLETKERILV